MRAALRYNNIAYTKEDILTVGSDIAGLYGGSCYGYRLDRDEQKVVFSCEERGEGFTSSISFDDLENRTSGHTKSKHSEDAKRIRFVDGRHDDLFYMEDGRYLQIHSTRGTFNLPCTYVDIHHTQIGKHVFHICEFAEKMERDGTSYMPEPDIMCGEAAWEVLGANRILLIQEAEEGYDYSIYDRDYTLIDGGVVDYDLDLSIQKVRDQILADLGLRDLDLQVLNYKDIVDAIDEV